MYACFVDDELLLLVSCLYICASAQCFEEYIQCTLPCCFYDLACFFLPSASLIYCIWNPTWGSSFFFWKQLPCVCCVALPCCFYDLACFFLPSFSSLIHVHCIYTIPVLSCSEFWVIRVSTPVSCVASLCLWTCGRPTPAPWRTPSSASPASKTSSCWCVCVPSPSLPPTGFYQRRGAYLATPIDPTPRLSPLLLLYPRFAPHH